MGGSRKERGVPARGITAAHAGADSSVVNAAILVGARDFLGRVLLPVEGGLQVSCDIRISFKGRTVTQLQDAGGDHSVRGLRRSSVGPAGFEPAL